MTLQQQTSIHELFSGRRSVESLDVILSGIREALRCSAICDGCADACLQDGVGEGHRLERLRLCFDCGVICGATAAMLARIGEVSEQELRRQLRVCQEACLLGAEACEAQGGERYRYGAQVARECVEAMARIEALL